MKLGTAIGGVLALSAFLTPGGALAQDACGPVIDGQVVCEAGASPFSDGIVYAAPGPEDLTVVIAPGSTVETAGDGVRGVDVAAEGGGSVTVSGAGVNVVTSGADAGAIRAISAAGAVNVTVGDITTMGAGATGVYGSTNFEPAGGDVTLAVGTVITYGDAATGIRAETYNGDININAGVVITLGAGSDAVYAAANFGSATVVAGSVLATGDGGRGITVFSQGTTTIVADDVSTTGAGLFEDADAGAIKAVGTAVDVRVGTVSTQGDLSTGIYANSNMVVSDPTLINPLISVSAGQVQTSGRESHGIVALNFAEGGTSAVTVDRVTTLGDYAFGVYGLSQGDVLLDIGTVATSGVGSTGVGATSIAGDIRLSADAVTTTGVGAGGIDTKNYALEGQTLITAGDVTTRRDYARAITAVGNGDVTISGAAIATNGFASGGVSAVSYLGDIAITAASIRTGGDVSNGVNAAGTGAIAIDVGQVLTSGTRSAGVYAAAYGFGDMTIHLGDVVTTGNNSIGVGGLGFGYGAVEIVANSIRTSGTGSGALVGRAVSNDLRIDVGSIFTTGQSASGRAPTGAALDVLEGDIEARFGTIDIAGDHASGIITSASIGDQHIVLTDSLRTSGDYTHGMLITGIISNATVDLVGTLTTTGDTANGISADILIGTATINASGAVTTSGSDSSAIEVLATSFGRLPAVNYGETHPYIYDATVTVAANRITTTGDRSDGVSVTSAHAYMYGESSIITNAVKISTGTVTVSGVDSVGVRVEGRQGVDLDLGVTMSKLANAVLVNAGANARVQLRGATTSLGTDAIALNARNIDLSILKGGGVQGAINGLVLSASGKDLIHADVPNEALGQIVIANAGTIVGGSGHAIFVNEGRLSLVNSGEIRGGVRLAAGDDTIDNTGTFRADKDSDFGAGADLFINRGSIAFSAATAARSVRFNGLERLENHGVVDLRNGVGGDVLTLSGAYVGLDKATLGLDIASGASDRLVIVGAATGQTGIVLTNLDGAKASLAGYGPAALVRAGAGSAADAFHIETPDIGLIHYGLAFNAAQGAWSLAPEAGASVYRSLKYGEAALAGSDASIDAFSASLADQRSVEWATGSAPGRVWAQLFGSQTSREGEATIGGAVNAIDYDQSLHGGQAGLALGQRSRKGVDAAFGVTAGYVRSKVDFTNSPQDADINTLNLGVYAAARRGRMFVNGLVKYDWHALDISDREAGYDADLDGTTLGARIEAGARFGTDAVSIEPLASLAWSRTTLDDVAALGQAIQFDDLESLTGKLGATASGRHRLASGGTVMLSAGLAIAHAFEGDERATLLSGGVSQAIESDPSATWGQATLGVTWASTKALTLFAQGQGDFGDDRSGGAVRVGARFSF